jgi:hypothetical protein
VGMICHPLCACAHMTPHANHSLYLIDDIATATT